MATRKLIAGNWKMNGLLADGRDRAQKLADFVKSHQSGGFDMVLCPPATVLQTVLGTVYGSGIAIGGQDCHMQESGAFTGDISAAMLKDIGAEYVLAGHSERRQYHNETSAMVGAKAKAAHDVGLIAIVCVGETDAERTAGQANSVVAEQLKASLPDCANPDNTVIAYEPVWAIGTGKVASADDIVQMHAFIRAAVGPGYRLLYGGSVKASNAKEILHTDNVDGVLVGGASLKIDEFTAIAAAAV
jgi:triosephosphate isomerase (TIM)